MESKLGTEGVGGVYPQLPAIGAGSEAAADSSSTKAAVAELAGGDAEESEDSEEQDDSAEILELREGYISKMEEEDRKYIQIARATAEWNRGERISQAAARRVEIKQARRRLIRALKNDADNEELKGAIDAADKLGISGDRHFQRAIRKISGSSAPQPEGQQVEGFLFVNIPASHRRELKLFLLKWGQDHLLAHSDDRSEPDLIPLAKDTIGKPVFAETYILGFGKQGSTTEGEESMEALNAWGSGPHGGERSYGIGVGEDAGQGVLRVTDAEGIMWDLSAVRDHSKTWESVSKEQPNKVKLREWQEKIENAIEAARDRRIEEARLKASAWRAGSSVLKGKFAYRGPNEANWNKAMLTEVHDRIVENKTLCRLFLEQNQLTEFPTNFVAMTALTELWLGYNSITNVDEEVVRRFARRSPLEFLAMDANQITSLPSTMGHLTQLVELRLNANHLNLIPMKSLGNLYHLQVLWLASNHLTSLPEDLGSLTSLRTLLVNNNSLECLPSKIGGWTALRELRAHENKISHLPEELSALVSLRITT